MKQTLNTIIFIWYNKIIRNGGFLMTKDLFNLLDDGFGEMVKIRRYLHQYPELSFHESKTANYISNYYKALNINVKTNVGGNGIVAKIDGKNPGPTVALRADFDGLPIQDEKEVTYKSKVPGVMHACGHDGHTASLLVLAKTINEIKDNLSGTIVFIHQHAEETVPGGAISMIKDGCLNGVDVIFGNHLWATEPLGKIQYKTGPMMAASDHFEVKIYGKGGHGAQPHRTKDAIVTGSQLVINLQQVVSRSVDPLEPAVVTVSTFESNNGFNIIADSAYIAGTVRTFDENIRHQIENDIGRITKGICDSAGTTFSYHYHKGYPAVVNHPDETKLLAETAITVPEVNTVEEMSPSMAGEDFAYYLQKVKGSFFFTGAMPVDEKNSFPHHHPKFDIDERAMLIAAKTLGAAAINYIKNNSKVTS